MFTLSSKNYLCIVGYHRKFLTVKKAQDMSADSLKLACKLIFFSEIGLPKKIMSDAGGNFISDKFRAVLQKYESRASDIIIIPSPEQWTSRGMYRIH